LTSATENFSIEESLKPIALNAIKAIKEYESRMGNRFSCSFHGKLFDLSGVGKRTDLIVTTINACGWGSSAGPVWILRSEGGKYKVVFRFVTVSLEILKEKSNGLHKIKTSRGTAGSAEIEFWAYNGKIYNKTASYYFSADDEKTCKEHPDICPFEWR
jgi:hypothetical protein